ncbi:MAG: hypothetical protein ABIF85_07460 [Nanoarchaeota archaeon]|nr:hypothetical protein [Nanoarchaeota archaeon]MBU4300001.1 hypothetical protein [Nanoarchaeota archaeon]MCG2724095.1 hypothetical protein [archaeon]
MEFKTISAKMPIDEVLLFKDFCKKKGVSPAALIRELILQELDVPIPHTVSGKNKIAYNQETDRFIWSVELDNGQTIEVLNYVSSKFLENLLEIIEKGLNERASFIGKTENDSVPVPSGILRRKKL